MPSGTDENDNAGMAQIYNTLDSYAARLRCTIVLIHHSTKGNQSGKGITDVGAGAGSQSRAADTHLILRPHQETDVVVLDAVTRSWKPVEPICLRWQFPVWTPDSALDPAMLRPDRPRRPKEQTDKDNQEKPVAWTAERFAAAFITSTPQPKLAIIDDAIKAGLADKKAEKLLNTAAAKKFAFPWVNPEDKRKALFANIKQPAEAPPEVPPESQNNIYLSPPSTPQA